MKNSILILCLALTACGKSKPERNYNTLPPFPGAAKPGTPLWDYKTMILFEDTLPSKQADEIKEYGDNGWEAVLNYKDSNGRETILFRRPK